VTVAGIAADLNAKMKEHIKSLRYLA
jgi:hypothetical protein